MTEIPKLRKLQSTIPCRAKSDSTEKPCKFTAKPGHVYCGQHLRVINALNERVQHEAVWLVPINAGPELSSVPVLLGNIYVVDGILSFVWHPITNPKCVQTTRMDVVDWDHCCTPTIAEIQKYIIPTTIEDAIKKVQAATATKLNSGGPQGGS